MAAYATGADLVDRYDVDLVGDLSTDEREPQDVAFVATSPKVLTALEDASGEVEAALLAGGRYTVEQLAGLTGNSASHLKQIVCGLAIAALFRRRPEAAREDFIKAITEDARNAIYSLRRGENVFGLAEHIDASVAELTGPSAIDIRQRNDLPERMGRYFPDSATRIPRNF